MRKNGRKDLVNGLKRRAVAAVVTGGLAISLITMASEISPSKTMPDFENHNSESEEVLSTESIVSEPVVQETLAEKPTVEKRCCNCDGGSDKCRTGAVGIGAYHGAGILWATS